MSASNFGWNATRHGPRNVHAYVNQTLSSGAIKRAVLGNVRANSHRKDLAVVRDSSLELYSIQSEDCALTNICSAPLFGNALDIACLRPPLHRSCAVLDTADLDNREEQASTIVLLSESGALSLVYVELYAEDRYRFRLHEQIQISPTNTSNGSYAVAIEQPMLRKIACDRHSRAIGLVSWLHSIELVLLDWSNPELQCPQMCSMRPQVHTNGVICDAAILSPSRSASQQIMLVAAVANDADGSYSLHLYESWTYSNASSVSPSLALIAKLPLPHDISMPLHIISLPSLPECFLLVTENEIAFVSAVQILSGDVHLCRQPLPASGIGSPDLVSSFCVVDDHTGQKLEPVESSTNITAAGADSTHPSGLPRSYSSYMELGSAKFMSRSPSTEHRGITPGAPMQKGGDNRRLGEIAGSTAMQKVYICTQSGSMFQICVTNKPSITLTEVVADTAAPAGTRDTMPAGETMVYLGNLGSLAAGGQQAVADYAFVSGDCTDHSIIRISTPGNPEAMPQGLELGDRSGSKQLPCLTRRIFPALTNPSPMLDFTLCTSTPLSGTDHQHPAVAAMTTAYWTSGRLSMGAIHKAQFGRAVEVEQFLDTSYAHDPFIGTAGAISKLWCFQSALSIDGHTNGTMHSKVSPAQLFVIKQAESCLPFVLRQDEWQVFDPLLEYLSGRRPIFLDSLSSGSQLLYVDSCSASILTIRSGRVSVERELFSAGVGQVFTHGAYTESLNGSQWAILAVCATFEDKIGCGSQAYRKSAIRITDAAASTSSASNDHDTRMLEEHGPVELRFEHEVSALKAFTLGASVYIAIGTYEPRLYVYRLESAVSIVPVIDMHVGDVPKSSETFRTNASSMDMDGVDERTDVGSSRIINDICMLYSQKRSFILLGLRTGSLVHIAINGSLAGPPTSSAMPSIHDIAEESIGRVPVEFSSALSCNGSDDSRIAVPNSKNRIDNTRAMMATEGIYTVEIDRFGSLNIVPCFGSQQPLPAIYHLAPLFDSDKGSGGPCGRLPNTKRYLAVTSDSSLVVLGFDFISRCHIHELPIGDEPRRVIVDSETGMLVTAGALPPVSQSTSPFPTSCLKVIDPKDGYTHAEVRFRPYELAHSLEAWHIKGRKSYRYICVGTGMYPNSGQDGGPGSAKGGRLLIYNLKTLKRKKRASIAISPAAVSSPTSSKTYYELKYVWESERAGPVAALAHLGESYLVVAAGASCIVLQLDVVQKQLIECCEIELRFPATSLHVRGNDIAVGSQREAVHVLRFVPGAADGRDELEMVHCARIGLCTADAQYLSRDLVVGVDRMGYLFGLGIPEKTEEFALDYVFGMHLGTACTRLKQGHPVQCLRETEHARPWCGSESSKAHLHKEENDSVLISTASGALWTLFSITGTAYRLLHQLELAMLATEHTHPAHPLMCIEGSISRARQRSDLVQTSVIDGALSSVYLNHLTEEEQYELLSSSPGLRQLAANAVPGSDQTRNTEDLEKAALEVIRHLIHDLNRKCTY